MKKSILLFAIIFSLFSCSKDDEPTPTPQENYRLTKITYSNGVIEKYKYDAQNKISEIEMINLDQTSYQKRVYSYNSLNKLINITNLMSNYNGNDDYYYDSNGNLIETITQWQHSGSDPQRIKNTYSYSTNGRLLSNTSAYYNFATQVYQAPSLTTYLYNSDGKIVKTQNESAYSEFIYDSRGNKTNIKRFEKFGATFYLRLEEWNTYDYKIDPMNLVFKNPSYINNWLTYVNKQYNSAGVEVGSSNISRVIEYNAQGLPTKIDGNVYTYETY